MRTLAIDLETYSSVDISDSGVYAYVNAPDFEILLLAYAWDDEPVRIADLARGESIPFDVRAALTDKHILKTAFNAAFERVCLSKALGIELDPQSWQCTAVYAGSRNVLRWKNKEMRWSAFLEKLEQTTRTAETVAEYRKLGKDEQDNIKDVGGYVGGVLKDGLRRNGYVRSRSLITLDVDFATPGFWDDFALLYDYTACVYSTHKHTPEKPRLRLILPLSRPVSAEEYKAIARRIAGDIGIDLFDDTTYEPTRLMYWPSTPQDAEYLFRHQDGPWLDADEVLARYHDWRDVSKWPESSRTHQVREREAKLQGDPTEKPGLIGAFCRAYTVQDVLEKFLEGVYLPTEKSDRYTYAAGSTAAGLIVYGSGKFAYSHHGTDPAGGKLCNAFDLVRLHLFGDLDTDVAFDAPTTKLKSYEAMIEFARKDEGTLAQLDGERMETAKADFDVELPPDAKDWMKELDHGRKGEVLQTIDNAWRILRGDPVLKGAIWYNEFSNRLVMRSPLPWHSEVKNYDGDTWGDEDDAALRHYFEKVYGFTVKTKLDDALAMTSNYNSFHPVREYLAGLKWDGVPRLDTVVMDYLGAEDSEYNRQVTRKMFTAAVARVMRPGCKFDNMLVLVGKQGIGKSQFIAKMARRWYSDSLSSVGDGKNSYEQLQGVWVIEMGELNAMRKRDAEEVKGFLSKQEDIYRAAYARRTVNYPRQCVFFGTTNKADFLQDPTGNRRFWPVDVGKTPARFSLWNDLTEEVIGQIWAEAAVRFAEGEKLYLDPEMERVAAQIQRGHELETPKLGQLQEYLDRLLPADWKSRDITGRRLWIGSEFEGGEGTALRTEVCAAEIWAECFQGFGKDLNRQTVIEIHDLMRRLPDWELMTASKRFGEYGIQHRWYKRIIDDILQ